MAGRIHRFLAADHRTLDDLLARATAVLGHVDQETYASFRAGLLKHIGMEEKVLFPAAQENRHGEPLPAAAQLRRDHGALVALLVPSPTPAIIAALKEILRTHDPIEEDAGGVYDQCEELAGVGAGDILQKLSEFREVRVLPHVDTPFALEAAQRAIARAGYAFELQ